MRVARARFGRIFTDKNQCAILGYARCRVLFGGEVRVGYLVRIYLKREPDQNIVNIGEQEIFDHPHVHGRATFFDGLRKNNGRIDSVDPADWEKLGTAPKIIVVVSRGL
jgi:hypothetical protein